MYVYGTDKKIRSTLQMVQSLSLVATEVVVDIAMPITVLSFGGSRAGVRLVTCVHALPMPRY